MKFVNGVFGCVLLLLAAATPIGCDYLSKEGPTWTRHSGLDEVTGVKFSSGLVVVVCIIGSIATFVCGSSEPPKDANKR